MVVEQEPAMAFAMLGLGVALYFIPTIIAAIRLHPNRVPIMLLNLFVGWTFIGWIAALIWSASAIRGADNKSGYSSKSTPAASYDELEKLADLKERGHITAEEFEAEKSKILNR